MPPLRLNNDDFRGTLEAAVAYRMTEMYHIRPEVARKRVRDFAQSGLSAEHHGQVLAAGYDLFKPTIGAAMPFLRALINNAVAATLAQVARGEEAERHQEG